MAGNRVKAIRLERGLTQSALAALAHTNQQQIQRIEAGVQKANLGLAKDIAGALGVPMEKAFPPLKAGRAKPQGYQGVENDPEVHTLRAVFRGADEHFFPISSEDKSRLWSALQRENESFVVFDDGRGFRIALNTSRLALWQFLFDPAMYQIEYEAGGEEGTQVELYVADAKDAMELDIHPDRVEFDFEDNQDEESVQLQQLFFSLDGTSGRDADGLIWVVDVDGETVFIRPSEMTLLRVPLWLVEPKLLAAAEDDEDEATD